MSLKKAEFWIATIAALLFIALFTFQFFEYDYAAYRWQEAEFTEIDKIFHWFNLRIYLVLLTYASFLFLNQWVFGSLYERKKYDQVFISFIINVVVVFAAFYTINYKYPGLIASEKYLFSIFLSFGAFLAYTALKKLSLYLKTAYISESPLRLKIARECLFALLIWMVGFLIVIGKDSGEFSLFWILWLPCAFIMVMLNVYNFLPALEGQKNGIWNYLMKVCLSSLLLCMLFATNRHIWFGGFLALWLILLVISTALSWFIYHNNKEGIKQLVSLKSQLGNTTADLAFLRSQINPHFLFNALNTLYGTALEEGSGRTAEGIQKLGDMMRFMLHENAQVSIPLPKEAEYLQNYIELQMLRIQSSGNIDITTDINTQGCQQQIAPMLLIPFVENAFKHGISLKHKSWVKVSLNCDAQHLYLDVYNSLHERLERDPEKDKSGIGLENVKQRLELLYPGRYELNIRKTAREFIIHLTLKFDAAQAAPEAIVRNQSLGFEKSLVAAGPEPVTNP